MNYFDTLQKLTLRQKSRKKNDDEYMNTYMDLLLTSLDTFEWENLPDTCNERMLEWALNMNGCAIIAKVNGALMTLIATPDGSLNIYGDPAGAYGYGFNGFNQHFNLYFDGDETLLPINKSGDGPVDAVLCKDNKLMYPFNYYLTAAAQRIADSQRSIDTIAIALKSPIMITCEEKDVQNVKKILSDTQSNTPFVLGMGGLPYDTFKVLDMGANPESLKTLNGYRENLISQIRGKMGIKNNPETDKMAQLTVDEVNVNDMQTALDIQKRLKEREEFADRCNKFFGTNISVSCKSTEMEKEMDEKREEMMEQKMDENRGDDDDRD